MEIKVHLEIVYKKIVLSTLQFFTVIFIHFIEYDTFYKIMI